MPAIPPPTPPYSGSKKRVADFGEGSSRPLQRPRTSFAQRLAQASGATLGYIVNNIPGAVTGYQLADMAYRARYRGRRSRRYSKKRMYKKSSGISNTVTAQRDFNTQYKKRRMGRGKKIRWKKFVNKVQAVLNKDLGLKSVVFNDNLTANTSSTTDQQCLSFSLYGNRGTSAGNTLGANDLVRMFSNEPLVSQGIGPLNPKIGKLLFGSAVLDMTINNIGQNAAEVDIYFGYHTKDVTSYNIVEDFKDITLEQPINSTIPNVTLDILQRGVTPFDLPTGLSQSGFHILKKQKLLIQPGQQSFIQHRDPRNHMVEWTRCKLTGYAIKKLTFTVLLVFKPVVGFSEGNARLAVGCTRKYSYTANENITDESALNP